MQWAAITVVLIANPLLGGLAKTSLDRCLLAWCLLIFIFGTDHSHTHALVLPFLYPDPRFCIISSVAVVFRCLGSLMGASVAMIGAYISTHGAFYVPLTAISIYGFHIAGEMLDAGYSAKIAMLSFILGVATTSNRSWRVNPSWV